MADGRRQLPLVRVVATAVVLVVEVVELVEVAVALTGVAAQDESADASPVAAVVAVVAVVAPLACVASSLACSAACAMAPPMATNAAVLATAVIRRARRAGWGRFFLGLRVLSSMAPGSRRGARTRPTGRESCARTTRGPGPRPGARGGARPLRAGPAPLSPSPRLRGRMCRRRDARAPPALRTRGTSS